MEPRITGNIAQLQGDTELTGQALSQALMTTYLWQTQLQGDTELTGYAGKQVRVFITCK